ncbi:transcription initiation factor TFIID subunit 1 isoform X1 [Anopheles gambiae]|uniref:transcription initiation factor TFIID subunit 1 isoform X1 n=1 Tax=Anopheles gambiae TaxID=7165 RepID=UPI002AC9B780|nr:transcription initiation factor TFIID subunit 1 isoform X1 [Anopheles gambiae]
MSNSNSDNENEGGLNLAGFLFGNVDENGHLDGDFLDEEAKQQLSSLSRMGLSSFLADVLQDDDAEKPTRRPYSDSDDSSSSDDDRRRYDDDSDGANYKIKADCAVDYSDITELAEESAVPPPAVSKTEETDEAKEEDKKNIKVEDDIDDIEAAIPCTRVDARGTSDTTAVKEENASGADGVDDKDLMPPPTAPVSADGTNGTTGTSTTATTTDDASKDKPKKLETPLAAMLPSKYQNVDVREFFPDFRPDKVLRFSRLFGPGKISSLPQIWRSVRRRRNKKSQSSSRKPRDGSDSTSDSDEPRRRQYFTPTYASLPPKDMWASDEELRFTSREADEEKEIKDKESDSKGDSKPKVADWRYGPAQKWYDMLDVPDTGEDFNYGFKQADPAKLEALPSVTSVTDNKAFPDDAFLMVSQLHWEDDVVWDGNDIKHKVLQKLNSKVNAAGWLPSSGSRTAGAFSQPGKTLPASPASTGSKGSSGSKMSKTQMIINAAQKAQEENEDAWYSIFPVENDELVYDKWEDDVIWDAEAVTKIPKPKVLTLDANDENIILCIPDDIDPSKIVRNTGPQPKVKIPHPHVKKSKILLGKAGVINVLAEDTPPPPPKSPDRDPYNISNDVFYMAKSTEATLKIKVGGGNLLQHSTPTVELRAPFVPTHMGPMKLRMFHRPPMKKYSYGSLASSNPQPVLPLQKHIKKKAKQRELERIASGGGDVFFMRTPEDLTGRDGELILIEFCEEHPPLMNQVGMASKIKNFYKRKMGKDPGPPEFRFGETHYAHTSPFLGILHHGQCIQAIENNMYRAPIYPHTIQETDFLVIRTRNNYFVREMDALFTAGQECPLYEVPGPNSKRANNFVRDFLQVFIYRLFWKSRDNPRKIRMDDIKKAFPAHSESSIRKRLKLCADFKRTGMDSNFWVIKPEFRLPSEEEIRAMVSPEQCCAYFSMIAAEQRLKDAGYGEKFIFAQQEDDDEEMQLKMDDEVKVAPWNTTRAYIQAMRGKCILQLNGPADPTGCGEGFSYVRMPNKPTQQNKEETESQPKRTVTGTDADLRRLSLNNAKALLRKFQVPEEEIKKLSRWEVIDVVRTLSTEKAKAGEEGMDKFSRGNRFSIAEHQERYKEECQRIFDLQNRVLASSEVLSTDEGESTASEESDLEELGKNLENMLANKKTSTQLSLEREEQERQELLRKIMEEQGGSGQKKKKDDEGMKDEQQSSTAKILKITRTFKNAEGREYTRVELVRRSPVIDAYVKIRTTKDEAFIRQFATLDEALKEEMKREKRRIQEQLRRIKRNQQKIGMQMQNPHSSVGTPISLGDRETNTPKPFANRMLDISGRSLDGSGAGPSGAGAAGTPGAGKEHSPSSSSRRKAKIKPDLKLKCGACGQVGHMRTNKACPQYSGILATPSLNVAMTEEQEEEIEKELNADDEGDLVNVDGTKVKLSSKLLKRHEDVKRRTLLLKVPKEAVGKKRRRVGGDSHCDYLQRHNKTTNRQRTDPVVVFSSVLEQVLNELRDMQDVQPFLFPVNAKQVVDYHKIVQRPMDLQTIRDNVRQKKYQTRDEFLMDINQIVENSALYNGAKSSLTVAAQRLLERCKESIQEREERLTRLEKSINPLLDDDDQVALSYILGEYVNGQLKSMPESWPFLKPVNKRLVKDYYTIIRRPMDLEKVSKKVASHKYHSRIDFLADLHLIADNSEQYNGAEANFTKQARQMVEAARQALDAMEHSVVHLERNIALVQERARNEDDDMDWEDDEQESKGDAGGGSRDTTPDLDDGGNDSNPDRPPSSTDASKAARAEAKRARARQRKAAKDDDFARRPYGTAYSESAMPFPIVRPNAIPSYHRPGPKLGSNVGGMAGFVGNTEAPRAISRSSSSTVPESSQMMHPNVAASAYEMNWMNLGADNYDEMPGPSSGYGSFPNQYGNEYGGSGAISAGFNESQSSLLPDSFGYDARNQSTFQPIRLATAQKRAGHQYSTDDEEFEEVGTSDNEGVSVTLEQSNTTSSMMPPQSEDDSQQAAEAMVQLSSAQYYNSAQDESMEIDPNYDPSDFLGMSSRQQTGDSGRNDAGIQQSLEASYSVDQNAPSSEYSQEAGRQEANDQQQQQQQFQYQPDPTGQSMDNPSQQPAALPTLQTLHSDLAISDSDDEKTNLQMDEVRDDNDDNDEGGDLWF